MSKEKKKKNVKHKTNKKLILIIIGSITILAIILLIVFSSNKNVKDIKVSKLQFVEPLNKADEAKAAKLIKKNIVRITNKIDNKTQITGTGFFTKDGYLLTNSHVVDILGDINIQYEDGKENKAYLYANSIEHDVALLKVEDVQVKALSFGSSNSMEVTNNVLAAGYIYNFDGEATISKGILSARRTVDGLTYLQTDVAIDTGSSGGPLFNDKAEVIGLNTFVTENRTFALSMSAETINLIVSSLLKEPTIQYLTNKRPANPINKILVEVNYTEDDNYCLYDDNEYIEKSKKENKDKLDDMKDKEDIIISSEEEKEKPRYYCETGYTLIGKSCFKHETYQAKQVYKDCPSGYKEINSTFCNITKTKPFTYQYSCSDPKYKVNNENKCEYEGYISTGTMFFDSRLGSCPKDKKCYEYAADFGDFYAAPTCNSNIPSGSLYIWEDEEAEESNIKVFYRGIYSFVQTKIKDENGITYYENISTNEEKAAYKGCYEKTEIINGQTVYVMKKIDSIRNTACPEGTLKAFNNENGFAGYACLLKEKPSQFYWNTRCSDSDAKVIQDTKKSEPYCAVYKKSYLTADKYKHCPDEEYSLNEDQSMCIKHEAIEKEFSYECTKGGKLNGQTCFIEYNKPAIKTED